MNILRKFKSDFTELFSPARCTATLPDELKQYHVAELKLDGSRYMLYLGYCPYGRRESTTLLSRTISRVDYVKTDGENLHTHVDKTDNIPHLTHQDFSELDGTVLDGECFLTDWNTTTAIMGSSATKAVLRQENGWTDSKTGREFPACKLSYYVWDILSFRGRDISRMPLTQRRKILIEVVKKMDNPYIKVMPQFTAKIDELFLSVVGKGGEGLIIKDIRQGYGMGWSKMKKSHDISTVVTGFKQGNGKYSDQIGALEVGVYSNGTLHAIGWVSGFDDKQRAEFTENFDEIKGKVLDVFAHDIGKPKPKVPDNKLGRLRHPTFHRFREDVNAEDCTIEKLKTDIKKKPKTNRFK